MFSRQPSSVEKKGLQRKTGTGILAPNKETPPSSNPKISKNPSARILDSSALTERAHALNASQLMLAHRQSSGDHHHAKLGEYTAQLYKDKSMTDVLIVVQGEEFKAHKSVLACYSPYFNEVLNKPGFNEMCYLQIPSVTARAFEILLDYMYTGQLKVNCQELSEVYRASKKLAVSGAKARCVELLQVTQENFQNMVYLYVTSGKLDLLDASSRAFKLMVTHFEKIITTKEFLELEIDQVVDLFSTEEIGARSEVIVFMAALMWLDSKFLEREQYVERVFDCVRFPLMTMQEILACYHPPLLPGLMVVHKIRQSLLNATCYIAAKAEGQDRLFAELAGKPRKFLFAGEPTILWDIDIFDPDKYAGKHMNNATIKIQAWVRGYRTRKQFQKEKRRANKAATVIQSAWKGYRVRKQVLLVKAAMQYKGRSPQNYVLHTVKHSGLPKAYTKRTFEIFDTDMVSERTAVVYAMGPFDAQNEEKPNSLLLFDTSKKSWAIMDKCLAPRHDSRMVYLDGHIYIIGGFNPTDMKGAGVMLPLKECLRYHVATKEWRVMPEMSNARYCHAATIFNAEILAIGGKNEKNEILSSIERYDISVGRWKKFSPGLPEPCMAMGCIIHQGSMWIAGGITNGDRELCIIDSVWCLDNKTCRWTQKVVLSNAIAFPTLMSDGENLFCVGGATRAMSYEQSGLESIDKVYIFGTGRWIEQVSLPFGAHSIVGCNVGKKLYVFGGISSHTMSRIAEQVVVDLDEDKTEKLGKVPSKAGGQVVAGTITWQ